jgi:hypothetical protein
MGFVYLTTLVLFYPYFAHLRLTRPHLKGPAFEETDCDDECRIFPLWEIFSGPIPTQWNGLILWEDRLDPEHMDTAVSPRP